MAKHNHTGKTGEAMGLVWLQEKGYTIKEQNWRHSRFEVDACISTPNGNESNSIFYLS